MTAMLSRHVLTLEQRHGPFLLADGRTVATSTAVAALTSRHRRQVEKHCKPVGRHRLTGSPVYDIDECQAVLAELERRNRAG